MCADRYAYWRRVMDIDSAMSDRGVAPTTQRRGWRRRIGVVVEVIWTESLAKKNYRHNGIAKIMSNRSYSVTFGRRVNVMHQVLVVESRAN